MGGRKGECKGVVALSSKKVDDVFKLNNAKILLEIEELVTKKRLNYIDAVILWCDEHKIEVEAIAGIIKGSPKFRNKVKKNAEELNFLPKSKRLPV